MTEGQLTIGSDHESSIASLSSLTEASGCVFASTDPRQASKYVARLLAVSADRGLQRGQLTLSQPYLNHVQKTKYHCVCAKVVCRLFRRDGGRTPFRLHFRRPWFIYYQAYPEMIKGSMLSDAILSMSSMNVIAGELDA